MTVICPVHKQQDMIQSISAVVSGGISSGRFTGPSAGFTYVDGKQAYTAGSTTLYGTMTTDLASRLAAPKPPDIFSFWAFVVFSFIFLISVATAVGPFLIWPKFKNAVVQNPEYQEKTFNQGGNFAAILMLFFGWYPVGWIFIPSFLKSLRQKSEYDLRYNQWVDSYKKWETLYYCQKCDIVYDPQNEWYYKPERLQEHLHTSDYL